MTASSASPLQVVAAIDKELEKADPFCAFSVLIPCCGNWNVFKKIFLRSRPKEALVNVYSLLL